LNKVQKTTLTLCYLQQIAHTTSRIYHKCILALFGFLLVFMVFFMKNMSIVQVWIVSNFFIYHEKYDNMTYFCLFFQICIKLPI